MAQKKKAPAKSSARSAPKAKAASAAKPSKKVEMKAAPARKPASKAAAQPAAKSAKPQPKATKPVGKPIKATVQQSAKAVDKKAVAPAAVKPAAAKPAAAKPAPAKPVQKPGPVEVKAAAPAKPAAPVKPAAAAPAASRPATPQPVKPKVAAPPLMPPRAPVQFGTPAHARSVPSALPKAAVRTFPAPGAAVAAPAAGMPRDIAQKTADARQQQMASAVAGGPKKPVTQRHGFKINESIVYPAHGVGRIIGIEEQEIAGMLLELFVIQFEKDKMTLKVPSGKLQTVGMRKLAEDDIVGKAMETLKGRARVKRTMWSRRAQEYEAKINSGDLVSIAEVVRDLYRSENQPEQSYSERQLYEAALDRMAREIAAVLRIDERGAVQRITEVLAKSAKGRRAAEASEPAEAAEAEPEGEADAQAA